MKKILLTVFLGILLFGLLGAGLISAQQEKLQDCCKINQKFYIEKDASGNPIYYEKGDVVMSDATGAECTLTPTTPGTEKTSGDWGMVCLVNTVYTVTNWIFYILTLVAVLMIVFGGFTYITAAGDPAKAGKGKSILVFAIIGLAIALIAKLIPTLVRFIIGV